VIGAFSSDWLAQRDKRWSAWIAGLGLALAPLVHFVAFRIGAREPSGLPTTCRRLFERRAPRV
jgi:hypothetical protein